MYFLLQVPGWHYGLTIPLDGRLWVLAANCPKFRRLGQVSIFGSCFSVEAVDGFPFGCLCHGQVTVLTHPMNSRWKVSKVILWHQTLTRQSGQGRPRSPWKIAQWAHVLVILWRKHSWSGGGNIKLRSSRRHGSFWKHVSVNALGVWGPSLSSLSLVLSTGLILASLSSFVWIELPCCGIVNLVIGQLSVCMDCVCVFHQECWAADSHCQCRQSGLLQTYHCHQSTVRWILKTQLQLALVMLIIVMVLRLFLFWSIWPVSCHHCHSSAIQNFMIQTDSLFESSFSIQEHSIWFSKS